MQVQHDRLPWDAISENLSKDFLLCPWLLQSRKPAQVWPFWQILGRLEKRALYDQVWSGKGFSEMLGPSLETVLIFQSSGSLSLPILILQQPFFALLNVHKSSVSFWVREYPRKEPEIGIINKYITSVVQNHLAWPSSHPGARIHCRPACSTSFARCCQESEMGDCQTVIEYSLLITHGGIDLRYDGWCIIEKDMVRYSKRLTDVTHWQLDKDVIRWVVMLIAEVRLKWQHLLRARNLKVEISNWQANPVW